MPSPGVVRSDFDSEIFGVDFYRVVSNEIDLVRSAIEALPEKGVIVDAKFPTDVLSLVSGLDDLGFRKVSTLVEFETKPAGDTAGDPAFSRSLTLNPFQPMVFNNRGYAWAAIGELDKALADYTHALEIDPAYASVYFNRAAVWFEKGDLQHALQDAETAVRLDPENTLYRFLVLSLKKHVSQQ